MSPAMRDRYQLRPLHATVTPANPVQGDSEMVQVKFRAVNLHHGDTLANTQLAFAVEEAIRSSRFFDKEGTHFGQIEQVGPGDTTFTFEMVLKLQLPTQ